MTFMPKCELVSPNQVKLIHETALKMLDRFGIEIADPEIRDLMLDNGCKLIHDGRVQISRNLIEDMINSNKKKIHFKSLYGKELTIEAGKHYTHTFGGAAAILDLDGNYRNPTAEDLINGYRLNDSMDNIDMACTVVYPADMDKRITQYVEVSLPLLNSQKPVYGPGLSEAGPAKYIAKLNDLLTEGDMDAPRPFLIGISPQSPLIWPKNDTDCAKYVIKSGIPTTILVAPLGGLTGPVTVIGNLTQCHAEILAFATLYYLINPETVRIYASRCFFPNMQTCQLSIGLPENAVASAITAQLASYCGFISDINGGYTTSCASDVQIGYEKMLNCLLPAMSGATMITGAGAISGGTIYSPVQHVIDDEIYARIMRILSEKKTDEDVFGFEALEDVVLGGNTFLQQLHTVQYLRQGEIFQPSLSFNGTWEEWERSKKPDIREKAADKVRKVLGKDGPEPLDQTLIDKIAAITAEAEEELLA